MVKQLKDDNAPSRPLSAYIAWQNSCRDKVKKGMPDGYSFGDLAAKFSSMWKSMSDGQKGSFVKKASAASEKYHKAMAKYKLTDNYKKFQKLKEQNKIDGVKKQKFKKDDNAPTRPQSAYFLFMGDERDDLVSGGMDHKDAVKKLGEMWSKLSAGKKKPYEDKAAAAKAKYEKVVEKYHKTTNYKKYIKEKEEFDVAKKADLKKLREKQAGLRPKSRSRSKSVRKASRSKSKAKKRSRSKSKAKKRSRSKSKSSKKRSRSRSKAKAKKRSKSRSRSRSRKKN